MEIATGKVLEDEINWIKFGSVSWTKDDAGFFYSRFPEPGEGETFQALNYNKKQRNLGTALSPWVAPCRSPLRGR